MFSGLWGRSGTEVYAVGSGVIRRFDGTRWHAMQGHDERLLTGVWGAPDGAAVFAVAIRGIVLRYSTDAAPAVPVTTRASLYGICNPGGTAPWAVGSDGAILRQQGGQWLSTPSGTRNVLYGIWGPSPDFLVAVGAKGTLLHGNGQTWETKDSPTTATLRAVWGRSANDIYAVGDGGTILHYDGARWSLQDSGTQRNLHGISGNASTVMAVGQWGTVLSLRDGRWVPMALGAQPSLKAIAVDATGQAVAVGDIGALWEFDGTGWVSANSGTNHGLLTVARVGQAWWVAGSEGTILTKTQASWHKQKSGPAQLMGVGLGEQGQVLIVGALGTVYAP